MSERARAEAAAALVGSSLDDASPATVTDALAALGVTGSAATDLAEQVHRARRENDHLRRREYELAALFSSARELAELRDTDALLERLVQRAHQMMPGDVTYLSEFDPTTNELHVRVTSGSVSPAFRSLRVPPGRGLASVIVETRAAQWVSRYDDYSSDRHEAGIDEAVAAEGLVSLLGVPLLSDGQVLGVLFVATRTEHDFSPEEIALLSALADHGSVVLQTAETLRSLQRSTDEARRALDRLTRHLAERDRANTVHQELVQAVLAGGGFGPVAQTLASALGRTVRIVDEHGAVIASAGDYSAGDGTAGDGLAGGDPAGGDAAGGDAAGSLPSGVLAALDESRRSGHSIDVDGVPGVQAVAALTAGAQYFGCLVLGEGEFDLGAVDRRTVERAAQVGALLALQQQAVLEAEHRVQSEVVADLIEAAPERRADVERRARRIGVTAGDLDSLLLFALSGDHRVAAARALGPLLQQRSLIGEHHGFVVALYCSRQVDVDPEDVRGRLGATLGIDVTAVVPPRSTDIPAAFRTASRTARLLAALQADGLTVSTDDYLPYSAVLDADAPALGSFLNETIGTVRSYDAERSTDLLGTLRAFVRSNASPTKTARALHFHPNTILQRLDRLDQVLGDDWRSDERLFRIGIAVRLDELQERLHPGRD